MSSSRKRVALAVVALGILLMGVAVVSLWPQRHEGGSDRAALIMPEDVAVLAWSAPLGEILEFTAEVGLTSDLLSTLGSKYAATIDPLGFDPLDSTELATRGFDLEQPLALGVAPGNHSGGLALLYVPMVSGAESMGLIRTLQEKLSPLRSAFVDGVEREHAVLWVHPVVGAAVAGAVVQLDNGFVVFLPLEPDPGEAGAVAAELELAVTHLLDPEVRRVADLPGYSKAVAGSGGSIAGLYVNPSSVQRFFSTDIAGADGADPLANAQGAAAFLAVAGNRLTATGRIVGPEGEDASLFTKRDRGVVEFIPGKSEVALHVALSAPEVVAGVEKLLARDKGAWKQYVGQKQVVLKALQLPADTELHQLWDGEIGIFVSELALSPESMLHNSVAFLGLDDLGKVKRGVSAIGKLVGEKHMTEQRIGKATAWHMTYAGMTMGLMVHRGRLWFGGDLARLVAIEAGRSRRGNPGTRAAEMMRGMREANGGAMHADLAAITRHLPGLLTQEQQEILEPFSSLLGKLDYLTWRGDVEGNIATGKLSLTVASESLRELIIETVAAQLTGLARGEQGIQKGAAIK
jgi:hypothetical protein